MSQFSVATELARYGPHARRAEPLARAEAVAYCRNLARGHYENFTVASWLLPRHLLPHFYAVYAYCRWADDLADETDEPEESLKLLDWWEGQLRRCYSGQAEHPVFIALLSTIEEFSIPPEPFARLLTAFRQDQWVTRYATAEDLLGYCRNSANPVGRLVLYVGKCHNEEHGELSDSICTGLQLANFCQDVARDWARDRVYLPRATLDQAGYTDEMFARGQYNEAFRQAMRVEVDRAEHYLRGGEALVELMPTELRIDIALFIAGGLSILRAIRDLDYNVWRRRPRVSRLKQLGLLTRCWWRTKWPSFGRLAA
ncbi:MAG: squalene synthase HpnC [Planctomycetia bacterium]|nr:squalene synthase HpnC [Planctomycetia bacterium]